MLAFMAWGNTTWNSKLSLRHMTPLTLFGLGDVFPKVLPGKLGDLAFAGELPECLVDVLLQLLVVLGNENRRLACLAGLGRNLDLCIQLLLLNSLS